MSSLRCMIIDDEELARKLLQTYVDQTPQLECVASCRNALEALEFLQEASVDLLFLDIQMPRLTGIELAKALPQKPMIIFTTAYPNFALEGFELDAVDYLLKPFEYERFLKAVLKAGEWMQLKMGQAASDNTLKKETEYLWVKSEHKLYKIKYKDIAFIEGMREYVRFHLKDKRVMSLQSLRDLEDQLPGNRFLRIHKSYLIGLEHIEWIGTKQVQILGQPLPIGASYRKTALPRLKDGPDLPE